MNLIRTSALDVQSQHDTDLLLDTQRSERASERRLINNSD